jgi:AcrR family transcriptional regulator
MSDRVNRRRYDATGRRERARQTRLEVVAVAKDLFVQHGYTATKMSDVAAAAGVSVELLYSAFGSKPALLKTVFDVTIAGDDTPVSVMDRPELLAVRAEADPVRALRLYAHFVAQTASRAYPVQLVVLSAASSDPVVASIADDLSAQRLHGMTMFAAQLARSGRLAVPEDQARDLLWTLNSVQVYDLLVVQRGWTLDSYERLLGDTWTSALLTQD